MSLEATRQRLDIDPLTFSGREGAAWILSVPQRGAACLTAGDQIDNQNIPHLVLLHHDFDLADPGALDDLAQTALEATGDFRPRKLCFHAHGPAETVLESGGGGVVPYKRILAAPVATLAALDVSNAPPRIELQRPDDLAFYDDYRSVYDVFWESAPHLKPLVRIETRAMLQGYLDQDALRIVIVDGVWAGVIAAAREVAHGLGGFCIHERLIIPELRGRGIGSRILPLFTRTLPARSNDALWGTIVPQNQASMTSAARTGRVDIGGLFWKNLD